MLWQFYLWSLWFLFSEFSSRWGNNLWSSKSTPSRTINHSRRGMRNWCKNDIILHRLLPVFIFLDYLLFINYFFQCSFYDHSFCDCMDSKIHVVYFGWHIAISIVLLVDAYYAPFIPLEILHWAAYFPQKTC